MNRLIILIRLTCVLLVVGGAFGAQQESEGEALRLERVLESVRAAPEPQNEESYQRVYEAFSRLMQNMSQNNLSNVRRLVSRLNNLVGTPQKQPQEQVGSNKPNKEQVTNATAQQLKSGQQNSSNKSAGSESSMEEKTEQILNRLDGVNKNTDQNTLQQLNEDVSRLIGTLNESYLRNIRRVIERVNKVVGQPEATSSSSSSSSSSPGSSVPSAGSTLHQPDMPDRLNDPHDRVPGFPGWDELIVAVDRMQKSLATFVRSSTRLITSG